MKLILSLLICCLALHNGKGAPRTAVYKFVRCNPEGDQANCVTQKSPEMAWSPDLPAKLPASTAQYLEAEPEEGESPPWVEEGADEMEEEYGEEEGESPITGEEGESPVETEEGSGGYEGSAAEGIFLADWAFAPTEGETGSGETGIEKDVKLYKDEKPSGMRRLFPRPLVGEAKPAEQELREDHLLL